jgi:hypothetical protein
MFKLKMLRRGVADGEFRDAGTVLVIEDKCEAFRLLTDGWAEAVIDEEPKPQGKKAVK